MYEKVHTAFAGGRQTGKTGAAPTADRSAPVAPRRTEPLKKRIKMKSLKAIEQLPRRNFLLGTALLGLAGCAPAVFRSHETDVGTKFDAPAPARDQNRAPWYQAFADAQLSALIAMAQSRNLSLQSAREAITQAEAGAAQTAAGALPTLGASGGATRAEAAATGQISTSGTLGLSVGWVLDLFGANSNARAAAEARLEASRLSAEATRLVVEAAVASAYVELRYYQESIALTRRSLTSRRKSRDITRTRFELGDAAQMDLLQAEQLVAEGEAQLPGYEIGYDQALAKLATLLASRSADLRARLSKTKGGVPRARFAASVGVPAEVIRLRPDVAGQERLYQAAVYEIGVARSQFLPVVSLAGTITAANVSGGGSSTPWSFGPTVSLPIFRGGALIANLKGAEARAAQAHIAWKAAVLKAVEEVETALAASNRDARSVATRQRLASTSRQTVELAQANFSIGEGTFMTVLDAERSYLAALQGLAAAERVRALNYINLSLAAAGGTGSAAAR